jgi:hypothetical protein
MLAQEDLTMQYIRPLTRRRFPIRANHDDHDGDVGDVIGVLEFLISKKELIIDRLTPFVPPDEG